VAIDVRLLGPLEILDGEIPLALAGEKPRALFLALALRAGEIVSTDELAEALWEGAPPDTATATLQMHVAKLRKTLGREAIATEPPGYRLTFPSEAIDARRFERRLAAGRASLRVGDAERAARLLSQALALWRGSALADVAYAGFAQVERRRLDELRLEAVEERVEADLACGRHEELMGELEALVAEHPLRERLRGQLMLALYRSGRQADALDAYQTARRSLVDELGIDPGAELQELQRRILNQDPGLAAAAPPSSRPRLPAAAHPLIGRRDELERLAALLTAPEARLLTLTGPGGIGKTRLALELARRADDELPGGAWFLSLAAVRDPELVLSHIASACGVSEEGSAPSVQALADAFPVATLVVLDNFEQVVEAAGAVASLVEASPWLRVLVTSRERLHVRGEREVVIDPLAPDDAVEFFLVRAEDAGTRLERTPLLEELCRRLDALPLALELAASRTKALSAAQILERLSERLDLLHGGRDADPRQQTLRATIGWSYDLLPAEEQVLFRRLAVFAGGCTLEAAEAVCEANLEALQALVEKSLLRFSGQRFWMLETIRQYAGERLEPERLAFDDRHAAHFTTFAADADRQLRGDLQVEWIRRVDDEHANCTAALRFLVERGDGERAADLASSLFFYWVRRGKLPEAREWLLRIVDLPIDDMPRIRVLLALANVAIPQGLMELGRSTASEAVALARGAEHPELIARALSVQALSETAFAPARSRELHREALALFEQLGDANGVAKETVNLGNLALVDEDYRAAVALAARGCELYRALGRRDGVGTALVNLAIARCFLDDVDAAEAACREALAAYLELDDLDGVGVCLEILAAVVVRTGRGREAGTILGATERQRAETAYVLEAAEGRLRASTLSLVADALSEREAEEALEAGRALGIPEALDYALAALGRPLSRAPRD
jgi:predicted ATPase/DNA-binding SARP family transcriptional activator